MSALPFMNMYWTDYFGDTRHLSCEQHGAYLQLLGSLWIAGGSLPSDPKKLAKIASCTPSRWARIQTEVMAFFTVTGDTVSHSRVTFELKKAREKSIKRAEVGSRGGKAKALKNKEVPVAIASDLLKHSPEPEPEYNVIDKSITPDIDPDKDAWSQAVALLRTRASMSEGQARSFFGGLLKGGLRARDFLGAIGTAKANETQAPREYLTKAAEGIRRRRDEPVKEKRVSWV